MAKFRSRYLKNFDAHLRSGEPVHEDTAWGNYPTGSCGGLRKRFQQVADDFLRKQGEFPIPSLEAQPTDELLQTVGNTAVSAILRGPSQLD